MKHGSKIVFSGEGDESPNTRPGDVIVVLKRSPEPHFTFTRTPEGCHLVLKRKITLLEALTGFQFRFKHLDGRVLIVKSRPNVIYTTGHIDALHEEGMPLRGDVMTRGHLYIEFEVIYPSSLTQEQKTALKQVLSANTLSTSASKPPDKDIKSRSMENDDGQNITEEYVVLQSVNLEAERAAYAELLKDTRHQYDEDEGDSPHQDNPIPCR